VSGRKKRQKKKKHEDGFGVTGVGTNKMNRGIGAPE
jgi:hypothetical protein